MGFSIKIFIVLMFLSIANLFSEEEIQITTYYPAPYGDYENLVTNNLELFNSIMQKKASIMSPVSLTDLDPVHKIRPTSGSIGLTVIGPYRCP